MKVCVYDTGLIPRHSCEKLTDLTWMVRISRFTCKNHELEDAGKFYVQFFVCALLPYAKTVDIQWWVWFVKCSRIAPVSCKLKKPSYYVCSVAQKCTLGKWVPLQLGQLQFLTLEPSGQKSVWPCQVLIISNVHKIFQLAFSHSWVKMQLQKNLS